MPEQDDQIALTSKRGGILGGSDWRNDLCGEACRTSSIAQAQNRQFSGSFADVVKHGSGRQRPLVVCGQFTWSKRILPWY